MEDTVEETLEERGGTHGHFPSQGDFADAVVQLFELTPNWKKLKGHQRSAMRMWATKSARILFGDSQFEDHWKDVSGYAELVRKEL